VIAGAYLSLYAFSQAAGATDVAELASGARMFGVSFTSLCLGLVMGGLIGFFGASVLGSREFSPLP
jgi:hypothetical protein